MRFEHELAAALEAARAAGQHILSAYADFQAIPDARADITTAADRQSQEIILQHVRQAFPTDALCAEERTPTLASAPHSGPRLWVVDPIDGTRGFAQKNGEFSVMIAFLEEGRLAVGVVLEPVPQRLTYAVRGEGCWRRDAEGEPLSCRVTATANLADATLVQSHSRGLPDKRWRGAAGWSTRIQLGVKLARVARGEADLYVNHYPNFHDWDIAAGQILVEEAGGTVTGLKGQTIHYGSSGADQRVGLLASNGVLHAAAVARLEG